MILCLDVGNSHIFGGLYDDRELKLTFRKPTRPNPRIGIAQSPQHIVRRDRIVFPVGAARKRFRSGRYH